jgi:hypothetical protein
MRLYAIKKNRMATQLDGQNIKIMDLQVDIAVQMEYMRMLKTIGKPPVSDDAIAKTQQKILAADTSMSIKKKMLQKLSAVEKVEVMRFLEQYAANAPEGMRSFAQLAAFHSKLQIESSLLGEPQVVVASGMGGIENSLRFFVALLPISAKPLNDTQKHILTSEFTYVFEDFNAVIENDIDFLGKYPKFTMLAPLQTHPGKIVAESIKSCNELGSFLRDGAIISNVKALNDNEIERIWHNIKNSTSAAPLTDDE